MLTELPYLTWRELEPGDVLVSMVEPAQRSIAGTVVVVSKREDRSDDSLYVDFVYKHLGSTRVTKDEAWIDKPDGSLRSACWLPLRELP